MQEKKKQLQLIDISIHEIFELMSHLDTPVMETQLLKKFIKIDRLPYLTDELFEVHFSLYHALYKMKQYYGKEGYYLHLDCMRLMLLKIPTDKLCHHYFPEQGKFCSERNFKIGFCEKHFNRTLNYKSPAFDPLQDFYLNPENIHFGTEKILESIMKGVIIYSLKPGEMERAMKLFNIKKPNKNSIKKKYYELAKKYHSDKNNSDESMMKELNYCYDVLKSVYVV